MKWKPNAPVRRSSRRGFRWKRLVIVMVLLAGGTFFGFRYLVNKNLSKANGMLRAGNLVEARDFFTRVADMPFSRGTGRDGLGGIALLDGRADDAKLNFQQVLEQRPKGFGANPEILLDIFIDRGMYKAGKSYRDFLKSWKSAEDLEPYYLDFVLLALGSRELAEARTLLSNAPPSVRADPDYDQLRQTANRYEDEGELPVVISRTGQSIVVYNLERSSNEYTVPQLFKGWPDPDLQVQGNLLGSLEARDRINLVKTSIDMDLQKAAHQSMRGFKGTMVIVDTKTGQVLAAYGSTGLDPFTTTFEPGSVLKLLTYAMFLQHGGIVEQYAPRKYPSSVSIGGRPFYDWKTHGMIETVDQGMAVSCNLMFAEMGISIGWDKLRGGFKRFFDDRRLPYFFTPATLGSVQHTPENDYQLGRISIGLDHVEATSLGLALMAATIGNHGVMPQPTLIQEFINLRQTTYKRNTPGDPRKVLKDRVSAEVFRSMVAAVENENGTAHGAHLPGRGSAMKTGTAGDRPFDALFVGLLPQPKPRIAFGFYLASGGKAEFNGAKVARELHKQIGAMASQYLE